MCFDATPEKDSIVWWLQLGSHQRHVGVFRRIPAAAYGDTHGNTTAHDYSLTPRKPARRLPACYAETQRHAGMQRNGNGIDHTPTRI